MFRSVVFLCLFALIPAGRAATFTMEGAVSHALKHNPDLAAVRLGIEQARGRLLQSGRLSNPEVEAEAMPHVKGREFSVSVGFVQKFPLTNRLRLEKAVSSAEVAAAEAEVMAEERKVAAAVRTVAVKWLSLEASKALKERQIANSRDLATAAQKVALAGEGSSVEATQFELEAQQLSLDLLQLDSEKAGLTGEVRPLLGLSGTEAVGFTGSLPEPASAAGSSADLAARGEYQAAQAKIEVANREIALARAEKWEDIGVGLTAQVERSEDAPEGLKTEGFVGVKFSLPLPWWNKNEGKIQAAEAGAKKAEKEAESVANQIRSDVQATAAEMAAARRIVDETASRLLPKAKQIEDVILGYYRQAQPGTQLADVLRARDRRLALEQARLDALKTYHLACVRHQAALGR